jgi:hypothetical protein
MEIFTVQYNKKNGWSNEAMPDWDSENTLIITFGASEYYEIPDPIEFLAMIYPHSKIIGCSTSGEIYQNKISGGLAADGGGLSRTWVIHKNKPTTKYVTAIGFCGNHLNFGYGTTGGKAFGSELTTTKSEGRVVFELHNQTITLTTLSEN